jgi:type IV pilus assembly protein PilB
MADDVSNPLLSLVKDQGLIDDLQYEEVAAEFKRSGNPVIQILQDFGIMDLDAILQTEANYLGTEVVSVKGRDFPPALLSKIPTNTAKLYQCLPIEDSETALKVALAEPLDPGKADELGFVVKKDVQVVIANPVDIIDAISKHYGEEGADVSDLLKQLGADEDIAKEVSAAGDGDDARIVAGLANEAPIVKFVNLVLFQAVQDRASDIHFEPFETEFRIRYRVDCDL